MALKSLVEESRKNGKGGGRIKSTASKLILSAYRDKAGNVKSVVFYIGKNFIDEMGLVKGDLLDVQVDMEENYGVIIKSDEGKTVAITPHGRGVLAIKYFEGIAVEPEPAPLELQNVEVRDEAIFFDLPRR